MQRDSPLVNPSPPKLQSLTSLEMKSLLLLLLSVACANAFQHFEARQRHPIAITPDGSYLLALYSPASQLSIFAPGNTPDAVPILIAEIPVGTEPVSVRARNNDEVWVVNEVSDSVSVVSISRRAIIATLRVGDEPSDICFASGKAFVSCARSREIHVIDATLRTPVATIPVDGLFPAALTASPDGSKLYVASLLSGNQTTVLRAAAAPDPPAPDNTALPAPPKTALIVPASDPQVNWTTLDHDIAEIDTTSHTLLRWIPGVGTHLFDLTFHPDGSLWCANSDSLNLTRFEPQLRGEFTRHRLSRVDLPSNTIAHHDLNAGIARSTVPAPESIDIALAQPTAIAFNSDGSRSWVAAFNSDRVAEVDSTSGSILRRVDLRPTATGSSGMRGPRGLVLSPDGSRLFVLNKLADTLTTVSTTSAQVLAESPLGSVDPIPPVLRAGRGVLYDARLSGNGTMSCATCHLDAENDGIAWDLGDPAGDMLAIPSADLSIHDTTVYNRNLHPMKGPMVTQTLRGLSLNDSALSFPSAAVVTKFHWRGDKPSIQSFNTLFPNLMGGTALPAAEMDALAGYLTSIIHHPNPNRNPDRSLKADLNGADAVNGRDLYINHSRSHCMICHGFNAGTDQNLDIPGNVGRLQGVKNAPLRLIYQKAGLFDPTNGGTSLSGFGMGMDGTLSVLPKAHPYSLDNLRARDLADLTAFLLSFDTATAPAVGMDLTVDFSNTGDADVTATLALLESRAGFGEAALVASGSIGGQRRSFRWDSSQSRYLPDTSDQPPITRAALLGALSGLDALTFSGVLPDRIMALGGDRDGDGILDQDEASPLLTISQSSSGVEVQWPAVFDWYPETSGELSGSWSPWFISPIQSGDTFTAEDLPTPQSRRFFRLNRTW